MERDLRVLLYFFLWVLLAITGVILNILNIKWDTNNTVQNVFLVLVLAILQGSVLEFPVQTIATLIIGGSKRDNPKASADNLTLIMNYNLLAVNRDDIDECFHTMFQAYMGNMSLNVSIVLVSATSNVELRQYELECRDHYRTLIYDELFKEGVYLCNNEYSEIHKDRMRNLWFHYMRIPRMEFVRDHLHNICDQFAREFMVIHRTSKVLRKCGQYQDLLLLSEGDDRAYTYTDPEYYGKMARPYNQPLFVDSEDVENLYGRHFDYTLVLDADTGVPDGVVEELLKIAAAHPEKGIIQPSIKLSYEENDTLYMKLETIRQDIYEPMTNAFTALLGQCSFFGKGMIKNRVYIDNVIGTRENLIERVPIDVLSHDTFEAALLKPYYAGSTHLLEAPSFNYITWNIRERRWNRGEVLLAMYFWKNTFGFVMRGLQRLIQRSKFNRTILRTESKLDFVTSYVAHSALRQMFMKPLLLVFIVLHIGVDLKYPNTPILVILFLVIVFPKFATCNFQNLHYVLIETVASFWQFTPEAIVGCVRILRSLQANLSPNCTWVPQRTVEEEFRNSNPFLSSLKHLWFYSLFSLVAIILVAVFLPSALLILCMLVTLCLLPLFSGFTSLTRKFQSAKAVSEEQKKQLETFNNTYLNRDYEQVWNTAVPYIPGGITFNPAPYLNYGYIIE